MPIWELARWCLQFAWGGRVHRRTWWLGTSAGTDGIATQRRLGCTAGTTKWMMMAHNKEKWYSPKRKHSVGSWGQKRRVVCKDFAAKGSMTHHYLVKKKICIACNGNAIITSWWKDDSKEDGAQLSLGKKQLKESSFWAGIVSLNLS